MILARLAALVLNQAHHITPDAAAVILDVLAGRIGIDMSSVARAASRPREPAGAGWPDIDVREGSASGGLPAVRAGMPGGQSPDATQNAWVGAPVVDKESGRPKGYRLTSSGVAIVPVHGELVNRGAWVGASSGLVSYEGLRHALRNAAAAPKVKALVLDVDSPGGMVTGMIETAGLVRAIAAEKPVIAAGDGRMASAAYGLSSGATRIVASETGMTGSIGTLWVHQDHSRRLDKAGVKVTLIHVGARKVEGNPFEPLPEAVRTSIMGELGKLQSMFVGAVAEGRRMLRRDAIEATEAAVYLGRDAVDAGLADAVGTVDDAVGEAESATRKQYSVRPPQSPTPSPATPPASGPGDSPGPSKRGHLMTLANGAPGAATDPGSGFEQMDAAELTRVVSAMRTALAAGEPAAAPAAPATAPAAPAASRPAAETAEAAYARGRCEATARIAAILTSPEAKDRQTQARVIALESDMTPAVAARLLAAAPKESEGAGTAKAFYEAVARNGGAPRVPATGEGTPPQGRQNAEDWTKRVAAKYQRPAAQAPAPLRIGAR